jgi:hypothetical protein
MPAHPPITSRDRKTLPRAVKSAALVAGEFLCAHSTASFYGIVSSRNLTDTPLRDGESRFVLTRT